MKKFVTILMIGFFICSCKVQSTINLETDNLSSSDDILIKKEVSLKKQTFIFPKQFNNKKLRKKKLKEIQELSDLALSKYISGEISKNVYNQFSKEAKYTVQNTIYLIQNEDGLELPDVILDFLNTSIESLKRILT
jgi:hypothetical protein